MKDIKSLNIIQAKKILSRSFNLPLQINLIYAGGQSIDIGKIEKHEHLSKTGKVWEYVSGEYSFNIEGEWKLFKNDELLFEWHDFDYDQIQLFFNEIQFKIKIKDIIFNKAESKTVFLFNNNIKIIVPFSKDPDDDDWFFLFNNGTKVLFLSNGSIKIQKKKPSLR